LVTVVTAFAGEATADAPLSPFAIVQHGYWGNPPRPMTLRRAEDAAALTSLGAEGLHLDHLDAIYRTDLDGHWIYTDIDMLFGELHPADPVILDDLRGLTGEITTSLPPDDQLMLYAPLGVGHHVDHQIVHLVAQHFLNRSFRLAFYEDVPYAEHPGAVETALARTRATSWRSEVICLDTEDVTAKVSALSYYRSQLPILFGAQDAMVNRIWALAAASPSETSTGLAERIWWPA
jgi:hypothetical protein